MKGFFGALSNEDSQVENFRCLLHATHVNVLSSNINIIVLMFFFSFLQELFHGVEINSIKVGNSSRRDTFYGGEKNLTRDQDLAIEVLVHVGEDDNLKNKGQIQSLLEYPLTNTDFQSGKETKKYFLFFVKI